MLYIVVALKPEAQAFVDMYRLNKSKLGNYTLFTHKKITLIISGIGLSNAMRATETLMQNFMISKHDVFLNVGICGASREYEVGELLEIGSITYTNQILELNNKIDKNITCLDTEAYEEKYEIADMESFGFYKVFLDYPEITNIHILKVVSDNFEPSVVTKEKTKQLIFNKIEMIQRILKR